MYELTLLSVSIIWNFAL